jgi:hypothetical protein
MVMHRLEVKYQPPRSRNHAAAVELASAIHARRRVFSPHVVPRHHVAAFISRARGPTAPLTSNRHRVTTDAVD